MNEDRQTLTEIACIVDQSGSMHKVKEDAIGGFNQFLDEQRAVDGPANLTLTLFNHETEVLVKTEPIEAVDPLDDQMYRPMGMTALLDAVGATLDALEERRERAGRTDPNRTLVLILTDGKENASTEYAGDAIADRIERCDEREGWEFLFWGANADAIRVANRINISPQNVTKFVTTGEQVSAAFGQMSSVTQSFRETGTLETDLSELADSN